MTDNNNSINGTQNTIDAESLYGLQKNTGCMQGSCPANTINTGYYIPSLTEIASYNPSAPSIGTYTPLQTTQSQTNSSAANHQNNSDRQNSNNPQTGNEQVLPSQEYPDSPATVLNYGATMGTSMRENLNMSITDYANPYPVTPESIQYLNGFIRTQIGRRLSIDFLIGSNNLVTKSGYLLGVAQNYILINELDTNDITTCDFYNIKFIRFYY